MRAAFSLLVLSALVVAGCPPMGDEYEIVEPKSDAASGGGGGTSGSGGSAAGAGGTAGSAGSGAASGGSAGSDGGLDAADGPDASCSGCDASCCSGSCVDLQSDPSHCGACDVACPQGRSCLTGKCAGGSWLPTAKPSGFVAREKTAHVWTGTRMFVFGGADANGKELGDAALYDPITDAWTAVKTDANSPSPRVLATAVSDGKSVLVFGGGDVSGNVDYKDGAVLDLASNTWTKLPDAPTARRAPVLIWNNQQVLVWGGWDKTGKPIAETTVYDLVKQTWTVVPKSQEPSPRTEFAWASSSDDLWLSGGLIPPNTATDEASRAALATGVWTAAPKGPTARYASFGAWDGVGFWVWGGRDDKNLKPDGKSFAGAAWTPLASGGPTARYAPQRQTGWAARVSNKKVLIAGGMDMTGTYFRNGAVYDATGANGQWTLVGDWMHPEDHGWGAGVWSGQELIIWGGRTGSSLTLEGERYMP